MNREQYIESYKSRNGSTKNSSKSYKRYVEGVNKQFSQARRSATYKAEVRKAQKKRDSI